jgi:hypothetical protein
VVFSNDATVEIHLNAYDTEADLIAKIRTLKFTGGNTNTAAGLRKAARGECCHVYMPIVIIILFYPLIEAYEQGIK